MDARIKRGAGLLVLLLALAGCDLLPGSATPTPVVAPATPTQAATPPTPAATDTPPAPGNTATPAAPVGGATTADRQACEPTRGRIVTGGLAGLEAAPERTSVGQGHVLTGVVRSSRGCAPLAGARLVFWLTNPDGVYDEAHRASLTTDQAGTYRFTSTFPGTYEGAPPHIHLMAGAVDHVSMELEYRLTAGQTTGTFDIVLISALLEATATPQPTPAGEEYELSGSVLASDSGAPLADAGLTFWRVSSTGTPVELLAQLTTDAAGAYRFQRRFKVSRYAELPLIHVITTRDGYTPLLAAYSLEPERRLERMTFGLHPHTRADATQPTPAPYPTLIAGAACAPTVPDLGVEPVQPAAPERTAVGHGHLLTGVVRSSRDCAPLAGVRLEFRVADALDRHDEAYRATVFTDGSGAYRLESIPPQHIHIRATADGYLSLYTSYHPQEGGGDGTRDIVLIPAGW